MLPARGIFELPEIPVIEVTEEEMPALRERLARELADPHTYPFFEFRIYRTEIRLFLFHKVPHVISDGESLNVLFRSGATGTHNMIGGTAVPQRKIHIIGTKGEISGTLEEGKFTIEDVIAGLYDKLHRRHPHVFGDGAKASTPEEALALWKEMKEKERAGK